MKHSNASISDPFVEKVAKRAAVVVALKSALEILEGVEFNIAPEDLVMADNPVDVLAEAFDSARLKLADAVLEAMTVAVPHNGEGSEEPLSRSPKVGDRVRLNEAGERACGGDQKAGFETTITGQDEHNPHWWKLSGLVGYFETGEFEIIEDEA